MRGGLVSAPSVAAAAAAGSPSCPAETDGDPLPASITAACWVSYQSLGLTIPALVVPSRTLSGEPVPTTKGLVWVHGGYGQSAGAGLAEYTAYAADPGRGCDGKCVRILQLHRLASLGYWVLAVDYRGSGGHGEELASARDIAGKDVDDVAAGADYLRARFGVEQVVLFGTSGGAGIAAGVTYRYPEAAEGYGVISGASDYIDHYYETSPTVRAYYEADFGGSPTQVPDVYRARSAYHNVEAIQRPVLVMHADSDNEFSVDQAIELDQALSAAGKDHQLYIEPGAEHGFFWSGDFDGDQHWLAFRAWVQTVTGGDGGGGGGDADPPQTTIDSGPSGTVATGDATLTFSSDEAGSTFECRLDAPLGPWAPCASPVSHTGLPVGSHTFEARAIDPAGNTDPTPAMRTWTVSTGGVDTTPPDTVIDSAPSAWWGSSTATFTFSSTEEGSTFQCRLGASAYAPCASPHTFSGLSEKTRTFWVKATDPAGLTDPTPASWTFTVDLTPPNTTITAGPTGTVEETTAEFSFTSTQAGSSFECALDAGSFAACPSPATVSGLAPGGHTFLVRAVDPAGNVDASPATRSWSVGGGDTTPPQTSITSGPASGSPFPATFELSSSEPGSTFQCRMKRLTRYAACTSPHTVTGYPAGTYTLQVRAIDPAGNLDTSPAKWTWTAIVAAAPGTAQRR